MGWILLLIGLALLVSGLGPIGIAVVVVGIGLWIVSWITDLAIFVTLAKVCAVVVVVILVIAVLAFIFDQ